MITLIMLAAMLLLMIIRVPVSISIGVAALGIGLAVLMYLKKVFSAEKWGNQAGFMYDWTLNKYYFDENYDKYLYQPTLRLSNKIAWIDWELYDKYFINGFGRVTNWLVASLVNLIMISLTKY